MSAGFDNDKRFCQLSFVVGSQYLAQFIVNGTLRGRQHAQIQHRPLEPVREYDATEIPIPRDQQPALTAGDSQQCFVVGSRKTELGSPNDVMP